MYSLINCTPHNIHIATNLLGAAGTLAFTPTTTDERRWAWRSAYHRTIEHDGNTITVPPSGFRLACVATTTGPDLGCQVTYQLGPEAEGEVERLFAIFDGVQGGDMLVIASEISVRALAGQLSCRPAGLRLQAMWPVLARESLRLPMGERWANKLATLPEVTR